MEHVTSLSYTFILRQVEVQSMIIHTSTFGLSIRPALVIRRRTNAMAISQAINRRRTSNRDDLCIFQRFRRNLVKVPMQIVYRNNIQRVDVTMSIFIRMSRRQRVPNIILNRLYLRILCLNRHIVTSSGTFNRYVNFIHL